MLVAHWCKSVSYDIFGYSQLSIIRPALQIGTVKEQWKYIQKPALCLKIQSFKCIFLEAFHCNYFGKHCHYARSLKASSSVQGYHYVLVRNFVTL